MYAQCRHVMGSGRMCGSPALRNRAYCYYHYNLRRATRVRSSDDEPLNLAPPEDASSINFSVTQILAELAAGRIQPRRAGLLLYALQLASQCLRQATPDNEELVDVVEISPEGDELGPIVVLCDENDDCSECPAPQGCTKPWRRRPPAQPAASPCLQAAAAPNTGA